MAQKIYIVWKDYDGWYIEGFMLEPKSKVEDRLTELQQAVDISDYGTEIIKVIKGEELTFEPAKIITKIKLKM